MPEWWLIVIIAVAITLVICFFVATWPVGIITVLGIGFILALSMLVLMFNGVDVKAYWDSFVSILKDIGEVFSKIKSFGK